MDSYRIMFKTKPKVDGLALKLNDSRQRTVDNGSNRSAYERQRQDKEVKRWLFYHLLHIDRKRAMR